MLISNTHVFSLSSGGWGSLEYGSTGYTHGQVLGGRWKPLHNWLQSHIFRDTIMVCGLGAECVIKHDGAMQPFAGTWHTHFTRISDGQTMAIGSRLNLFVLFFSLFHTLISVCVFWVPSHLC